MNVISSLHEKHVLVTGGTRGLGRAIGLAFAGAGAHVWLTHKWGSVDEAEVVAAFSQEGLASPAIVQSDVSDPDEMRDLFNRLQQADITLDIIVSNVAFSKVVTSMADLSGNALELSLKYSAWPLVELARMAYQTSGCYPRYLIAISSDGGEICHPGYDLAGVSKSVLETLCRYLALRLKPYGVRVNALRPGLLDTESFRATFGEAVLNDLQARHHGILLDPRAVAGSCVALCSGLMDAVTGQVITVDDGWSLVSPITFITGRGLPESFE